jgi:hypothetical protein
MPYNERTPGGSGAPAMAHTYPISRAYAGVVLLALLVLLVLHRLFGSISIEVGAR